MRRREPPAPELGFVPPGGASNRCERCGKDISVEWIVCALSQMHPEEKWFIWQFLRNDQRLRAFRELKKQTKRIT
jgi:hypothetical protein